MCKNVIKNLGNNLIMIFTYIHDITSTYHDPSVSDDLTADINSSDQSSPLVIMGDLNSRTGIEDEKFNDPRLENFSYIEIMPRLHYLSEIIAIQS